MNPTTQDHQQKRESWWHGTHTTSLSHTSAELLNTTVAGVQAIAEETLSLFGGVDILVNNAASGHVFTGGSLPIPDSEWLACLETNFLSTVRLTSALLPEMLERGSGVIVNITSGAA
jgi:NAD(P)-dependent dehydrogenase (short-subunit alcohol dehydrogenase family)